MFVTRIGNSRRVAGGPRRRGAAAVEFALTAPILFALVLGAIEFSRANMLVHTASIAATEAARRGIVPGATAQDVQSSGMRELAAVGITDAAFAISPATLDDETTQVTVNLTVPVNGRNGYSLSRVFLGKQVFKSVTLQREGKSEDVANEGVVKDGMQAAPVRKDSAASSGSGGSTAGGKASSGSSTSSGSSSSVGSGSSSSGSSNSGSSNSGSGSSSSGSSSSGNSSGSSSSGSGGLLSTIKALLGL